MFKALSENFSSDLGARAGYRQTSFFVRRILYETRSTNGAGAERRKEVATCDVRYQNKLLSTQEVDCLSSRIDSNHSLASKHTPIADAECLTVRPPRLSVDKS